MPYSISACDALELRSDRTSGALDWPVSLWSRDLNGGSKLLGFLSARIDSMVDGAGRDIIDFAHGDRVLAVETRARAPRAISIGTVFPIGVFLQPNAGKCFVFTLWSSLVQISDPWFMKLCVGLKSFSRGLTKPRRPLGAVGAEFEAGGVICLGFLSW